MREKTRKLALCAAFWLLAWALAAAAVGRELVLPGPLAAARALARLAVTAAFWRSVLATLGRVLLGFLLATLLGALLGWATAESPWCDALLSPALRAVRTVPVVSFILLLYFSLPNGQVPTAAALLMALPVEWRAARQGLSAADPRLLELADSYRLGRWRTFRLVRLPAALPALAAGWETGLGLAWKAGVAAEVLCQPKWAMGSGLQAAKATLDAPALVAWTLSMVALSLLLERLLRLALGRRRGGED